MPILNYTTKVPVDRTMSELQKILRKAGAIALLTEFDTNGNYEALSFRIMVDGNPIAYRLPADVEGVIRALKKDKEYKDDAHARRVAWRIVKDWVEVQMAIIQAQMAELPQIFLPYAQTSNGQSFYHRIKSGGFNQLTYGDTK